jgi:hypothetical protein
MRGRLSMRSARFKGSICSIQREFAVSGGFTRAFSPYHLSKIDCMKCWKGEEVGAQWA